MSTRPGFLAEKNTRLMLMTISFANQSIFSHACYFAMQLIPSAV